MSNFKPMLAKNAELDKLQFPLLVQKKWDGERLIVKDGQFLSRSMKPITNLWLVEQLKSIFGDRKVYLDGEIQVNGNFPDTSGFVRKSDREADFIYHVFDCPMEDKSFYFRHSLATHMVWDLDDPRVQIVPYCEVDNMEDLMELHQTYSADPALDGTITRSGTSLYKYGRSTGREQQVMKLKDFDDSEGLILDTYERMHNTNEAQTNELGRTFRSSAQEGLVGTGMLAGYKVLWHTDGVPPSLEEAPEGSVIFTVTATGTLESRRERWEQRDSLVGKLVKLQYQGVGNKGAPRFPTELGLRDRDDLS